MFCALSGETASCRVDRHGVCDPDVALLFDARTFPGQDVTAITQTKDGFIWIGTRKGLVRYDGNEFKVFQLPNIREFQYPTISALASAADGGLWFGIKNGAFGYYRADRGFLALTNEAWIEPGMNVWSLYEASDTSLWVASGLGPFRRTKDGVTASYPEVGGCVSIFEDSHKRIWLGTEQNKIFCWQEGRLTQVLNGLTNEIPWSMTEDPSDRIWIGTQFGLRCFDASLQPQSTPPLNGVTKLLTDSHGPRP